MKKLLKSKTFIGTFLLIYFSFFVITIFILEVKKDGFGVGHIIYGFPFGYYYSSCFGGDYLWLGLLGNILFAAIISFVIGLISSYLWVKFFHLQMKFSSTEFLARLTEFRAKWYI